MKSFVQTGSNVVSWPRRFLSSKQSAMAWKTPKRVVRQRFSRSEKRWKHTDFARTEQYFAGFPPGVNRYGSANDNRPYLGFRIELPP
jgi:hypothetical protein